MRIGIQLYTLRAVGASAAERLELVSNSPFEGVQLAAGDHVPDELATALDRSALDVAGAHVDVSQLEDAYADTVADYAELGVDHLVVSSLASEAFETEASARAAGRRLAALADRLEDDGVRLHYHNHGFEFTALEDGTAFDAFADAADGVGLEIDTGLANYAGVDPVELLERYVDRVALVHLTDSRTGVREMRHADLGEGDVDLEGCVDAAAGADWVLFEHGLTDDPVGSMDRAADVLGDLTA